MNLTDEKINIPDDGSGSWSEAYDDHVVVADGDGNGLTDGPTGTVYRMPNGHEYEIGTAHDCGIAGCPANAPYMVSIGGGGEWVGSPGYGFGDHDRAGIDDPMEDFATTKNLRPAMGMLAVLAVELAAAVADAAGYISTDTYSLIMAVGTFALLVVVGRYGWEK